MRTQTRFPESVAGPLITHRFRPFCWLAFAVFLLLHGTATVHANSLVSANGTIAVDVYNNKAVTADRSGLVRLFDLTVPDHPLLISKFMVPRELTGIALAGDSVLVSGQGGVQILDISNPKSPQMRGSVELGAEATVVKAAGNLGYTAFGSTVVLFNVATGEIVAQRNYSELEVNDLALSADSLYVLSADPGATAGFAVAKLAVQGGLGQPTASWTSASSQQAGAGRLSLYAADDLIYVGSVLSSGGDREPGLEVLQDLGTSFKTVGLPSQTNLGIVRPSGDGLLAFTGASNQGESTNRLGILDITDPSSTNHLLQAMETSGPAYDVSLHGGYAYVAAGPAGLQVIAFASPTGTKKLPALTLNTGDIAESPQPGSLMRITAEVAAADQIQKVDFYVNGTLVASDGNYPFEYRFFEADPGAADSLTVYACAEDIDANRFCTTPTELNSKSGSGLKVVSVTPAASTHTPHSSKLSVSAQFSLPLDTTTVATRNVTVVKLAAGKSPASTIALSGVTYQAGSKSLLIQPKSPLAAGAYQVTLSSAIKSSSGSALASTYAWTFNVAAATDNWTSQESGNWSLGSNWSLGTPPGVGDTATITMTGVKVTLDSTAGNVDLAGLTVGTTNTLNIAGGSLSIEGGDTATINGTLNLSSGTLNGPGTTTVAGSMDWTGGGVTGVLTIQPKATLAINAAATNSYSFYLLGATLNNSGIVTEQQQGEGGAYGLAFRSGSVVNNLTGGVWNIASDVVVSNDGSANLFNNVGTFNKPSGTGYTVWSVPLSGTGPINLQSGDINLNGASTGKLSSVISISSGATLDYSQGGTLAGGSVTGLGTLNFDAPTNVTGTYTFAGLTQIRTSPFANQAGVVNFAGTTTIAKLNLSGGSFGGAGSVTVTGSMDWTGGGVTGVLTIPAKATLAINTAATNSYSFYLQGATLNNSGTVTEQQEGAGGAYGLAFLSGSVVNNLTGGIWNIASDVVVSSDGSANLFNNIGTFNKPGGTGYTVWSVPLSGTGPINLQSGDINLTGASTGKLSSVISISAGATLDYSQGGTLAGGSVTGLGTLNFDAPTNVTGNYTFAGLTQIRTSPFANQAGVVNFAGTTTIAKLNLSGGSFGGAGTVTVTGSMDWTGGGVTGVLTIPAKATLAINTAATNSYSFYLKGATLNNSGTVTEQQVGEGGAYGLAFLSGSVVNNLTGGVWNIASDVVVSTDGSANLFNNVGTFNKPGGTGYTVWSVPLSGAGPINLLSGDINLTGASTGKLSSVISISSGATLDYSQGGTLAGGSVTGLGTLNFDAPTNVTGTYTFAGLTQIRQSPYANQAGVVNFAGATTIAKLNLSGGSFGGAGTVTVTGAMDWTGGGVTGVLTIPAKATLAINTAATNSYSFYLKGATLNNSGTVTEQQEGEGGAYGLAFLSGSVVNNLTGGIWNIASDVVVSSDGSANLFNNVGTFNKPGGTGYTVWSVPLSGAGPINLLSGDINLNGASTGKLSSVIAISSGATLDYSQGGTLAGGSVTGLGTLNFDAPTNVSGNYTFAGLTQIRTSPFANQAGVVNFAGTTTIAKLNLSGGSFGGAGTVTVTGSMDWTGGGVTGVLTIPAKATLAINTAATNSYSFYLLGATLNNSGTVTEQQEGEGGAYGLAFRSGSVVNNLTGGIWNIASDVVVSSDGSANLFNNVGTFNKPGGTGSTNWGVPLSGSGPINLQSGEINLSGNFTGKLTSVITIAAGATLDYSQGGTLDGGSIAGSGTLNFDTGTNVAGNYTFAGLTQIQTPGASAVAFAGATTIAKLNLISGSLAGPGVVTVSGSMDWTGGGLTGVLTIPAKATLAINTAATNSYSFYMKGGTLNNSGTVTEQQQGEGGAYGLAFLNGSVVNNLAGGVWNIASDVVVSSDTSANVFNNAGTLNKADGANNTAWGVAYNNTGTLNVNSGTLSLTGSYSNATISGTVNLGAAGTLNYGQQGKLSNGTVAGTGNFIMNNNSSATTTVSGTFKITAPAQVLGGFLDVLSGATLDATDLNVTASAGQSGSTVEGGGTINVSDTLTWGSGTLDFAGAFNTKNLTMAENSGMDFQVGSGAISVSGSANLDGDISVTLSSNNPAVGKVFKVLNFANNFLGDLLDLVNIPIPGTNDYLAFSLSSSGLTITVDENSSSDKVSAKTLPGKNRLGKVVGRTAIAH